MSVDITVNPEDVQAIPDLADIKATAYRAVSALSNSSTVPSTLWHYTTAEGLLGILGTQSLRFSDQLFLNDGSEISWGIDRLRERAAIMLEGKPQGEQDFAERIFKTVTDSRFYRRNAVFCLSTEGNLLNQWRDYGRDIVPYSIEFDTFALNKCEGYNFDFWLIEIIYDPEKQTRLIDSVLEYGYSKIRELYHTNSVSKSQEELIILEAASELLYLLVRFKNHAFRAEQEWRLISQDFTSRLARFQNFRGSRLGVVPCYGLAKSDGSQLPVQSVMVGPSPHGPISDQALKIFLEQIKLDVPTSFSTIPIR